MKNLRISTEQDHREISREAEVVPFLLTTNKFQMHMKFSKRIRNWPHLFQEIFEKIIEEIYIKKIKSCLFFQKN